MHFRRRSDPGLGSGRSRYPGTFLLAFREAAEQLGWQIRRWKGTVVECTDAEGNEQAIGLENLYRQARHSERTQWLSIITEFLRRAHIKDSEALLPAELSSVADQLLPRLGQPLAAVLPENRVWEQELPGTGLRLNLVVDYPERMCYITEKLVQASNQPAEDWLQKAVDNLEKRTPAGCLEVIDAETGIHLCSQGDAYDASRVLLLERLLPDSAAAGYFVTLPGRDQLLVIPVSAAGVRCVPLLKGWADQSFGVAPYPISKDVFWIRAGIWKKLGVEMSEGTVTLDLPDELVDLLEGMKAKEEPEEPSNPAS